MAYAARKASWKGGFTLLEILVASVLAAIVMTVLVQTVIPTMRASRKAAARVDVHERAVILGERLASDLRLSARAGVGVFNADPLREVVIHRRQAVSPDPAWEPTLRVYSWQDRQVTGRTVTLSSPTPPGPVVLTPAALSSLSSQEFLRVSGVEEFSWTVAQGPSVSFTLKVVEGDEEQTLTRTVFLRNSAD